ncbi:CopG family transcriptional regulator [bacterium]|nr:MAG: CopG family transcriptional regulator [bacterium]
MAETLTVRLDERDREVLEAAARQRGMGLSAFVRGLAEAEARRLRRSAIRAQGEKVVSYLLEHPEAQAEVETYGRPIGELP